VQVMHFLESGWWVYFLLFSVALLPREAGWELGGSHKTGGFRVLREVLSERWDRTMEGKGNRGRAGLGFGRYELNISRYAVVLVVVC